MFGNQVESEEVEMFRDFIQFKLVLSVFVVVDSQEGINLVVDFVSEKEIAFSKHSATEGIDKHASEGELIMSNNGSVVPGKIVLVLIFEVNSESVI